MMTTDTNNPETEQPTPPTPGTEPGKQTGADKPVERMFTQTEMDTLIRDRLVRQEQSLLKKLGVTKLEEAQTATSRFKEMEEAQKTQEQKLRDQLAVSESKTAQAESNYRATLIRTAVIEEVARQGVASDRYTAAYKLLDSSTLTINDKGEVDGVAAAVKGLLEANPFLKVEPPKQGVVQPTNPASGKGEYSLDWFKPANRGANSFGRGGIVPPPGEE